MKICQRMRSRFDSGLDYIFFSSKTLAGTGGNFFKKFMPSCGRLRTCARSFGIESLIMQRAYLQLHPNGCGQGVNTKTGINNLLLKIMQERVILRCFRMELELALFVQVASRSDR